ncbi:807_t:CDS:2, partial [Ambispora leptoticha]
ITKQKYLVDTEMATPITELENTQTDNKMETDTEQESSNIRSYSQVTKQNLTNNTMQIDEDPTQKCFQSSTVYRNLSNTKSQLNPLSNKFPQIFLPNLNTLTDHSSSPLLEPSALPHNTKL